MKRSLRFSLALALLALSVTVNSAHAQNYYGRPNNNNNSGAILGGFLAGAVAGAIVGTILSNSDRREMRTAYQSLPNDCEPGYRARFEGDGHSGYHEYVNEARHRGYERCRQVRTVVYDQYGQPLREFKGRPFSECYNSDNRDWVRVRDEEVTIVVRERQVRPQPRYESDNYVRVRQVRPQPRYQSDNYLYIRQNPQPSYGGGYVVRRPGYGAPIVGGPAYGGGAPAIGGPAYGGAPATRPMMGGPQYAPPVMPMTGVR